MTTSPNDLLIQILTNLTQFQVMASQITPLIRKFVSYQHQFSNTNYYPNKVAGSQLVLQEISTLCDTLSMRLMRNSDFCGIGRDLVMHGREQNALQAGHNGDRHK